MSLRDIAANLVITKGKKKGRHPSPATVMRMLRDRAAMATEPAVSPAHWQKPPDVVIVEQPTPGGLV